MRVIALIPTLFIHLAGLAWGVDRELTVIDKRSGNTIKFEEVRRMFVSHKCIERKKCDALTAFHKANLEVIMPPFGQNPGSHLCKVLGGKIILGETLKHDDIGICQFPDSSFTTTGSLHLAAILNLKASRER